MRTFALLRQLILHASQRQPLVLAVENLHWSDPTSEEWLAALAAQLGGQPSCSWPPTGRVSAALAGALLGHAGGAAAAQSPHDSLAVVQAVPQAAQLPARQHQAIVAQAAGNPFFLEELTWAAVESGDHARPLPLPDTIQAVLAARLDRLPRRPNAWCRSRPSLAPRYPCHCCSG